MGIMVIMFPTISQVIPASNGRKEAEKRLFSNLAYGLQRVKSNLMEKVNGNLTQRIFELLLLNIPCGGLGVGVPHLSTITLGMDATPLHDYAASCCYPESSAQLTSDNLWYCRSPMPSRSLTSPSESDLFLQPTRHCSRP